MVHTMNRLNHGLPRDYDQHILPNRANEAELPAFFWFHLRACYTGCRLAAGY